MMEYIPIDAHKSRYYTIRNSSSSWVETGLWRRSTSQPISLIVVPYTDRLKFFLELDAHQKNPKKDPNHILLWFVDLDCIHFQYMRSKVHLKLLHIYLRYVYWMFVGCSWGHLLNRSDFGIINTSSYAAFVYFISIIRHIKNSGNANKNSSVFDSTTYLQLNSGREKVEERGGERVRAIEEQNAYFSI